MVNEKFLIVSDGNILQVLSENLQNSKNKHHSFTVQFIQSATKQGLKFLMLKPDLEKAIRWEYFEKV